jgi:hypothetical protein
MSPTKAPRVGGRSSRVVRIALAQINPTVGDLPGKATRVIEFIERARAMGTDIIAIPELALTGYPPEDLLLRPDFIDQNQAVKSDSPGITAIVGFAQRAEDATNAAIAHDGEIAAWPQTTCPTTRLRRGALPVRGRPVRLQRGPLTFGEDRETSGSFDLKPARRLQGGSWSSTSSLHSTWKEHRAGSMLATWDGVPSPS